MLAPVAATGLSTLANRYSGMKQYYDAVPGQCPACDAEFDEQTEVLDHFHPRDEQVVEYFIDCGGCELPLKLTINHGRLKHAGVEVFVTLRESVPPWP